MSNNIIDILIQKLEKKEELVDDNNIKYLKIVKDLIKKIINFVIKIFQKIGVESNTNNLSILRTLYEEVVKLFNKYNDMIKKNYENQIVLQNEKQNIIKINAYVKNLWDKIVDIDNWMKIVIEKISEQISNNINVIYEVKFFFEKYKNYNEKSNNSF